MKPIGPLMKEHRLIERMVGVLGDQLRLITEQGRVDNRIIAVAVDFFRMYAARTHHGKEEDILFRELDKKPMSPEHRRIMEELIQEHILAARMVKALDEANKKYSPSDPGTLADIEKPVRDMVALYPAHIEKEDKRFFYPILNYFTQDEQDSMLNEFWEFDRKLIHEKYQKIVDEVTADKIYS